MFIIKFCHKNSFIVVSKKCFVELIIKIIYQQIISIRMLINRLYYNVFNYFISII